MNNNLDQRMVVKMILDEIKNKNLPINVEQPQIPIVQETKKEKLYEPAPVSVFDAFTLILFTLNLIGMINISWFLVFLPLALPYIVIGITWCVAKLIVKFKKSKNETKTN